MVADEELLAGAREAREHAYAPYSGYRVGAVLEAEDGSRWAGVNTENASFGLTMCAERSAVALAVSAGQRRFTRIAISAGPGDPLLPCGACRQVLAEFAPALVVVSESAGGGVTRHRLDDLLPAPFVLATDTRQGAGGPT